MPASFYAILSYLIKNLPEVWFLVLYAKLPSTTNSSHDEIVAKTQKSHNDIICISIVSIYLYAMFSMAQQNGTNISLSIYAYSHIFQILWSNLCCHSVHSHQFRQSDCIFITGRCSHYIYKKNLDLWLTHELY